VTAVKAVQSVAAVPATVAAAASPVPGRVIVQERLIASVEKSVRSVYCDSPNVWDGLTGTGFIIQGGPQGRFATASHVVAACPTEAGILFGQDKLPAMSGTVSTNDRVHDLALVTYQPLDSSRDRPLRLESAPAYVGESLALIGMPGLSGFSSFQHQVQVVPGTVVATNRTVRLASSEGGPETLTDAIEVTAAGVAGGESGGPAIDAAGNVVGVIEGSGPGIATLTPARDLMSLH
jgi:S1-C subfamily serine protease